MHVDKIGNIKIPFPNFQERRSEMVVKGNLKNEILRLLIINVSLFTQHINLFDFEFELYNKKLFLYTFCITIQPLLRKLKKKFSSSMNENNNSQYKAVSLFQITTLGVIVYLFLNLYNEVTMTRVIFICY